MKIHIVKKGDTLYTIATKYEVPLQKLIDANPNLKDPNKLEVGMKIKIPVEAKPVKPEYEMMHKHDVKKGDTLWKLAKAWGIPLQDMLMANPQLKDPNTLSVGEVVYIPKVTGGMPPMDPHMMPPMDPHMMPPMDPHMMPPMDPHMMPMHDGGMNVSHPVNNAFPGVSQAMHEAHHHHHHHDGMHMGGENLPHYQVHQAHHQPVFTMPTNNCGCNTLSTHMPHDMYKGHPGDGMSEDLFAQFQVPATEAISLYDLPQVPQVNTSANWGGMPQGGVDGYPMPYGMNPYGMMDPYGMQMDPYGMQMHPYGHPGAGYGMPGMPFNPYGMPYGTDMYGSQFQPLSPMDHMSGHCGCHPRENEVAPEASSAAAAAPANTEPVKQSSTKSSESRSSSKGKARTSSKKSSSSSRRQVKPRKSRSMPWING
ncbi:LysM peptidoglycan-binding domain-containing protein [Paenibacillus terrigena]|uniref:LysM peptidoglycan-binding domain-containing protein n=1 Tax=Paenibacillus terrigena TaxID=369333 RepID=UPI0028D8D16B|nr:LysM peptidoglycan-binding domain-containing protein [Paenibacillus terrigena]